MAVGRERSLPQISTASYQSVEPNEPECQGTERDMTLFILSKYVIGDTSVQSCLHDT